MKYTQYVVLIAAMSLGLAGTIYGQATDLEKSLPTASATNASDAPAKDTAKKKPVARPRTKRAKPATAPVDRVYGMQVTTSEGYHNNPAIAEVEGDAVHTAWVMYVEGKGDAVVSRIHTNSKGKSELSPIKILSSHQGQFIRPVIAASKGELLCLWTETTEDAHAAIWFARFTGGRWSPAQRMLADEKAAHQNPEITAMPGGGFACVYQFHNGTDYDIHLALFTDGKWSTAKAVTGKSTNDWDPVCVYDTHRRLHVAWSGYKDGDYDIYRARLEDGSTDSLQAPQRLSARGEYDMHPWLAAAQDGSVWICWDVVRIKNHGYSGGSTITGANKQRDLADTNEGTANHWSGIEVRVLDGDAVRIPGEPREQIVAPQGYVLAHRGLGKIAISPNGEPWIIYRALMKPIAPWGSNVRDGYLWELQARPFRDGAWQDARVFDTSDGYLEEAGITVGESGIKVTYTSEHRHSAARQVGYVTKKEDAPPIDESSAAGPDHPDSTREAINRAYDHHHDFDGLMGWQGDVYLAPLPKMLAPDIDLASLPVEEKPADRAVDPRQTRATGAHEAEVGGETLKLFWGDLHRHSNVSRCSVGNEPNPEDLYRYGIDVDLYDFFGLSDHSEYTTDYYWWRQQKVADLFHIPGIFSVLYNSEWSMTFPNGHTNTVFPSRHNFKMNAKIGSTATLEGGWEFLRRGGYKAITIPHTPADPGMGTTWPAYDPEYMRLCEIFQSCRGSYEHDGCPRQHVNATNKKGFYWEALKKGYKLGIICSSDHGYGAAYACIYAPENTREAVWQALYDRRTYGSTTYGLVMEVHCGDHWMGEEFSSADAPLIEGFIRGATNLRSVEVIGREKVLFSDGSIEKPIGTREFKLQWTDPEWSQLQGEQWYYVRVIQEDDEMAWSSPMWITPTRATAKR